MGGRAGDDVDQAALLVATERADQVLLPVGEEGGAGTREATQVHGRQAMERRVATGAPLFLLG